MWASGRRVLESIDEMDRTQPMSRGPSMPLGRLIRVFLLVAAALAVSLCVIPRAGRTCTRLTAASVSVPLSDNATLSEQRVHAAATLPFLPARIYIVGLAPQNYTALYLQTLRDFSKQDARPDVVLVRSQSDEEIMPLTAAQVWEPELDCLLVVITHQFEWACQRRCADMVNGHVIYLYDDLLLSKSDVAMYETWRQDMGCPCIPDIPSEL